MAVGVPGVDRCAAAGGRAGGGRGRPGRAGAGELALPVAPGGVGLALLLPALLLVGAPTADLAARSCVDVAAGGRASPGSTAEPTAAEPAEDVPTTTAIGRGRPGVALACQVVPGLVLLATPEPAWRSFDLVIAFGGVLGFALATRAAPALCALGGLI